MCDCWSSRCSQPRAAVGKITRLQFVGVTIPTSCGSSTTNKCRLVNRVRYRNPDVDWLIEEALRRLMRPIGAGSTPRLNTHSRPMCRAISLWYKKPTWPSSSPDIHGVSLSPIADFTFLKDVYSSGRTDTSGS